MGQTLKIPAYMSFTMPSTDGLQSSKRTNHKPLQVEKGKLENWESIYPITGACLNLSSPESPILNTISPRLQPSRTETLPLDDILQQPKKKLVVHVATVFGRGATIDEPWQQPALYSLHGKLAAVVVLDDTIGLAAQRGG